MRADLHIHTINSDGLLTPEVIADEAKSVGVELVAVTDHDATQACDKILSLAKERGFRAVRGIEVSAYDGTVKFHTLGYGIDEKKFSAFEKKLFLSSLERTEEIIKKLNAINIPLTWEDINEQRYSLTAPVHGAHIARAMVARGFIESYAVYFKKFAAKNKPAFTVICRPSPEEAVRAITEAGGLAVVAHPGRIWLDDEALKAKIISLKDEGLGGIEVYYTTHTEEKTAYYKKLAEELSLLKTGGSDTHVLDGTRAIGLPPFYADGELLEKLKIDL